MYKKCAKKIFDYIAYGNYLILHKDDIFKSSVTFKNINLKSENVYLPFSW